MDKINISTVSQRKQYYLLLPATAGSLANRIGKSDIHKTSQ